MTVLLVIATLVVLIVAHEFGHFIAAKLFGVRVEEFGIGYPPRALLLGTFGDTEYTINWLPFGGFVRLWGDQGEEQRGKGSFVDTKKWKQAIILAAGVCMNVLVAWALFTGALAVGIPRAIAQEVPGAQLLVGEVVPGSPAAAAGIQAGDRVVAAIDQNGVEAGDLSPSGFEQYIASRAGERITLTLQRNASTIQETVIPANGVIPDQAATPAIGVALVLVTSSPLSLSQAAWDAVGETWSAVETVATTVWGIIVGALHGAPDLSDIVGPVGLVSVVGQAAAAGWGQVLALAGFISANLAVINLIPIPALDGGRLVVIGVEAATRRRMPGAVINILNGVGILLIIALMFVVTYHDIARLVT